MNQEIKDLIETLIKSYCNFLNFTPQIEFTKDGRQHRVNLIVKNIKDSKLLSSYNNELLFAMQYYIRVAVHQQFYNDRTHFLIDLNSQRATREKVLLQIIPDLIIREVIECGVPVILNDLNPYERKLIHSRFFNLKSLTTRSLGDGVLKKVIAESTSEIGVSSLDNAKIYDIDKLCLEYQEMLDKKIEI